jgi:hypothetical protein
MAIVPPDVFGALTGGRLAELLFPWDCPLSSLHAALHRIILKPMVVPPDTMRQTLGQQRPTTRPPNRRSVYHGKTE